jgi:hypothetical protein
MSIEETEEVLKQYLKIAASYSMPIFWGDINSGISANGTAFILDTGERVFVVTAAHVYRSYIRQKKMMEVNFCQLSGIEFDLESRLISVPESEGIDIATFEITQHEIDSIGANILRGSNSEWPPRRPCEENMVVVSGFPGLERLRKEDDYYSFGYYCFNTPVSSVSNRHFGCSFDRKYWIDALGKGLPPENYDMGGISGAPVIALIKSEAGIVSWMLAGIVYEAVATEMCGEIMFAHHADLVGLNGTVKESA